MKNHHLIMKSILAGALLLCCLCSTSPIAGGNSSGTGNNGIVVCAITDGSGNGTILGKTRASAQVSIYAISYNPYADSGFADTVTADDSGAYAFSALVPGYYNVMVKDVSHDRAGFVKSIPVFIDSSFSDTLDSLMVPGLLSGTLTAQTSLTPLNSTGDTLLYSIVYIPGSPFTGASDNRGRFLLGEIPAGTYEIKVVPNIVKTINGGIAYPNLVVAPMTATVESGKVTDISR